MNFKDLLAYFPVYTGVLIFFGYLNLHFFYRKFSINIYEFINTGELILSFLPILLTLLIIFSVLFILFITATGRGKSSTELTKYEEEKFNIKIQWKYFKERYIAEYLNTLHWFKQIVTVLFSPIVFFLSFSIYIINIIAIIVVIQYLVSYPKQFYELRYAISVFFVFNYVLYSNYFTSKIIRDLNDFLKRETKTFILYLEAIFIYLFFNFLYNYSDAQMVLDGKPQYNVSFTYNDSNIVTDNSIVYVGKTQNYLFVHDIPTKLNFIYQTDKIGNLKMIKLSYDNKK